MEENKTNPKEVFFSEHDRIQLIAKMVPTAFKIVTRAHAHQNAELLGLSNEEKYNICEHLPKVTVLKANQLVNEILNIVHNGGNKENN